jgi:hypothetical protein
MVAAHIEGMHKRPWQILAHTEPLGGAPSSHEYFIVQAPDAEAAVRLLHIFRADLLDARIDLRGEARPEIVDWLGVEGDVYSIQVLTP